VAVLGAGVLGMDPILFENKSILLIMYIGRRIACVWAAGGYNVAIRDPSKDQRTAALIFIDNNIASFYKTFGNTNTKVGQYAAYEDLAPAVKDAWFVIEAVPEKLDLKISTFAETAAKAPKDCIMGSNSSSFKSRLMVVKLNDEDKKRVLNVHYTMPPVRVTELMTSTFTDPAIFTFLEEKHREVGLLPATARKESTGYVYLLV
jgi:3-hydroxyacyl-CoA dehydrogenase